MENHQLLRYSRHILLPEIGLEGQARLGAATVLIVGLGGLGSPAALYLVSSGIGRLLLADDDKVDLSNLQRQILHTTDAVGVAKTDSAERRLKALNPAVDLELITERLAGNSLDAAVLRADVVVDGSDNFATRFAVNAACVRHKKPLIAGAAIRHTGQISVFRADLKPGPCYRCLYSDEAEAAESCSETGVLAPLLGIIGSMQAAEAIKIVAGFGTTLSGRLLTLDALTMHWREATLVADPKCPVCSNNRSSG